MRDLRRTRPEVLPDGFIYRAAVVTHDEERALIEAIAMLPLRSVEFRGFTAKRKAVHFGVGYDFDEREVTEAPRMPDFLLPLRLKAAAIADLAPESFTEALVME